jgi:hypothetical protein
MLKCYWQGKIEEVVDTFSTGLGRKPYFRSDNLDTELHTFSARNAKLASASSQMYRVVLMDEEAIKYIARGSDK